MRVIIFGAGRVGAAMALDLAADETFEVTVTDIDPDALRPLSGIGWPMPAQKGLPSATAASTASLASIVSASVK